MALFTRSNWNLELWFWGIEENRRTGKITLGAGTRTNNKRNPHVTPGPGIEPRPQRWEASALTTTPFLHPQVWGTKSFELSTTVVHQLNLKQASMRLGFWCENRRNLRPKLTEGSLERGRNARGKRPGKKTFKLLSHVRVLPWEKRFLKNTRHLSRQYA